MTPALLLLMALARSGPRFRAVVQVYRTGLWVLDGADARPTRGFLAGYSQDAELAAGPKGSFAVVDETLVATYEGRTLLSKVDFKEYASVIGWSGKWPIVATPHAVFVVSGKSAMRLPDCVSEAEAMAGDPSTGFLCELNHTKVGNRSFGFFNGKTCTPIPALGGAAGDLVKCGNAILVASVNDIDDQSRVVDTGRLCVFHPADGSVKLLGHHAGTSWIVDPPDDHGRCWITETGYFGRLRKFYDWSNVYCYSKEKGLRKVDFKYGEFVAYGLDATGRWLLGELLYGYEMGAYDLVAKNLKTHKQMPLLHGVEELQFLGR